MAAAVVAVVLASAASACDVPQPREPPPKAEEPSPFDRMVRAGDLYAAGHTSQAMDLVREEIAHPDPVFANNDSRRATMLLTGLQVLGDLVELRGIDAHTDAEAARYHSEAEAAARAFTSLEAQHTLEAQRTFGAQLDYAWGVFNLRAGRPGAALASLRRVEQAWEAGAESHPFDRIRLLGEMAAAHQALGHMDVADRLDATAWERARPFIASPPTYTYHYLISWLGDHKGMSQVTFLQRLLERRARSNAGGPIEDIWGLEVDYMAQIEAGPNLQAIVNARAAAAFVRAGSIKRARQPVFWWARRFAKSADALGPDPDRARVLDVTEAELSLAEGAADRAVALLSPIVREAEQRGARVAPSVRTALALGLEKTGDLDAAARQLGEAVQLLEADRTKMGVADRRAFFGQDARVPYWALVRVLAKRAATSAKASDFFEALRASERVRSRQLGEILAQRGLDVQSAADLDAVLAVIDPREVWLDFVVTDRATVLLVLTRDGYRAALLPLALRDLTPRVQRLRTMLARPRPEQERAARDRELEALSRDLLGPAAELLRGKDRWVMLPDGPLALLPLDLLSAPGTGVAIDRVEVTLAPSISLLRSKPNPAVATTGLFAVGDPHFGGESPLSKGERGAAGGPRLTPLPETRAEVTRIASLFPADTATVLLGERATESAVRNTDLRRYSTLHFATHGILGGQLPELTEPALAMARENGEDGFLTMSEIERLDLSAGVAVLSACDTGRGEYLAGEGVLGLGRAFLLAGARSVVVSLWPVDSFATEELMVAFYGELRRSGRPAAALRQAKLDMRAGKLAQAGGRRSLALEAATAQPADRSEPFYWAAFTLLSR